MLKTAVLFLVFNRPEKTAECFEAIRAARPSRLYVAADGPRASRIGESERCEQVRTIATNVDWPCELRTLFRPENLGCRHAVRGAISWFFEAEPEGIVLEDDCLASQDWFRFADEMLERYRDDERIMCISASHFHGDAYIPAQSYHFSRYNYPWGWASWRRAWAMYDAEMEAWPRLRDTDWLRSLGYGNRYFVKYWRDIFDKAQEGKAFNSWAYPWLFSCWRQHGLAILPRESLVANIGYDAEGTHANVGRVPEGVAKVGSVDFPLTHPDTVFPDLVADQWVDLNLYGFSAKTWFHVRIARVIRMVFGHKIEGALRFLYRSVRGSR